MSVQQDSWLSDFSSVSDYCQIGAWRGARGYWRGCWGLLEGLLGTSGQTLCTEVLLLLLLES